MKKEKLLTILLAISLLFNLLSMAHIFTKEESPFLDGSYACDFSRGIGSRTFYFDIIFYDNGTAFVQQRSFGSGTLASLDTTCPYYYSSESDTVTITFDWFGNSKTFCFNVSKDRKEIYDSGFTLVRGFQRDAENNALLPPRE